MVFGDGMVWKAMCVKQGDLYEAETRTEVRAFIVAMKRRNGRGAKGGRKVDALQSVTRNSHRYRLTVKSSTPETSALLGRTNRVLSWNRMLATSVMGVRPFDASSVWGCSPFRIPCSG